jgi:hypothetical protein
MALQQLADRRAQYGLEPPPDIPPPAGYGIGDVDEYDAAENDGAECAAAENGGAECGAAADEIPR